MKELTLVIKVKVDDFMEFMYPNIELEEDGWKLLQGYFWLLLGKVTSGSKAQSLMICFKDFPCFLVKVTIPLQGHPTI